MVWGEAWVTLCSQPRAISLLGMARWDVGKKAQGPVVSQA